MFKIGSVTVQYHRSQPHTSNRIESLINGIWEKRIRNGMRLYDGAMARYLACAKNSNQLKIEISSMDYRHYVAARDPEFRGIVRQSASWKPLSSGTVLETEDGFIVLGERKDDLDTFPGKLSSFAGWVDPNHDFHNGRLDLFHALLRELKEETAITKGEVKQSTCLGLISPLDRRYVYAAFRTTTSLTADETRNRVMAGDEFAKTITIRPTRRDIQDFLSKMGTRITPDCAGNLELYLNKS